MNIQINSLYSNFILWFMKKSGIDLSLYKEEQMKRRISSFYQKYGASGFPDASRMMENDPEMYNSFVEHITINVTEFYRSPEQWKQLRNSIIPELILDTKKVSCWSAACSSGEEPYSLSMVFAYNFPGIQVSILATDLDSAILDQAQLAVYPQAVLRRLPLTLKEGYLYPQGMEWKVSNMIREKVEFRKHNLLSDPFGSNLDLILCRNVMIYFTEEAKHQMYERFSASLREGGFLFVGGMEQINNPGRYALEAVGSFFYRKKKIE